MVNKIGFEESRYKQLTYFNFGWVGLASLGDFLDGVESISSTVGGGMLNGKREKGDVGYVGND